MKLVIILSSSAILALIALLHLYWAAGGRWGTTAVLPQKIGESIPAFTPGAAGTIAVAFLLLSAAVLLLVQGGFMNAFPATTISTTGSVVCAAVFFLRAVGDFRYVGFFKRIKHSLFARYDTWLYSPLCLFLSLAFVLSLL